MRKGLLLAMIWFTGSLHAQTLNVGGTFVSDVDNLTEFGINTAYMFHHILDDNYALDGDLRDFMVSNDFDLYRFPGGAIGNYYRLNGTGYGAVRSEVEGVANTVQCNGSGYYCFERDQLAPRNFIYDFLDLLEDQYAVRGEKTDVLWVLNLLLHFVYNYDEIPQVDAFQNMDDVDQALADNLISADFHERITENFEAMQLLIESPYVDIKGIEMGNEFYFYQEVTTFPYPPTNSNPFFNLNSALNTIQPRMERYLSLIRFYRRLIEPLSPGVKIGVPIGGVNHFGNMANADLLWNTAVKNWIIGDIDALIPHMYIKTGADEVDPSALGGEDDHPSIVDIKTEAAASLDTKFIGSMSEIVEFFGLDSDFRELWLTEYNVNKNASATQIWDEWTNTFLHGAFLQEWMKRIGTSAEVAPYMRYAIQHGWSGANVGFEHCVFTRTNDGDFIRRIAYYANEHNRFLRSKNTRKLSGNLVHGQAVGDLYADAYYSYDTAEGATCPTERLIVSYAHLRGDALQVSPGFPNGRITIDGKPYIPVSARMSAFYGLDLSSSCGRTEFNNDESDYEIAVSETTFTPLANVGLPGYSAGYVEWIIEPVNNDCLPLSTEANSALPAVSVYPNPTSDQLHIDLPAVFRGVKTTAGIVNALGAEVMKIPLLDGTVRIADLVPGVYFLKLTGAGMETRAASFVKF